MRININKLFTGQISPALVVHTGKLLGLIFYSIGR